MATRSTGTMMFAVLIALLGLIFHDVPLLLHLTFVLMAFAIGIYGLSLRD